MCGDVSELVYFLIVSPLRDSSLIWFHSFFLILKDITLADVYIYGCCVYAVS